MGPVRIENIEGKKYVLVIVDDFSRFILVAFFLEKNLRPLSTSRPYVLGYKIRRDAQLYKVEVTGGESLIMWILIFYMIVLELDIKSLYLKLSTI